MVTKKALLVLFFFLSRPLFSKCYDFSGRVILSKTGELRMDVGMGNSLQLTFEDKTYNPQIPRGTNVVGRATGSNGTFQSNKFSIDIPSRSVATSKASFIKESKVQDADKCLKKRLK